MMLSNERELLLHLAFRVLRNEEYWLSFHEHHCSPYAQIEEHRSEVELIRSYITSTPFGADRLRAYDASKKDKCDDALPSIPEGACQP